uniref:PNPLA domain-containing protein n=1 Tax=Odontella aurita TaxID=265563 RepID=A0A7S4JVP5_9STRA|mmetsp:Transcript_55311/g.165830  ORF Transcript_55311/g.165830 Transcript_55311/m.165830 type:complete len:993 (+) Transcript_55311:631-3609(+)
MFGVVEWLSDVRVDVTERVRFALLCKEDAGAIAGEYCSQPYTVKELLFKYVPVLVVVVFFWPVFLTLFLTVLSASSWAFWLLTSLCVGIVQMLYVAYQFFMIFLDLLMISALKTFATLRSQIRYYTIKSGLSKRRSKEKGRERRRGRRREWRNKVDGASTYGEYCDIEIEDVETAPKKDNGSGVGVGGGGRRRPSLAQNAWKSLRGLQQKNAKGTARGDGSRPPLVPRVGAGRHANAPRPGGRMRKSQSCVDMDSTSSAVAGNNGIAVAAKGPIGESFARVKSSDNFNRSQSEGTPDRRKGEEHELKMAGGMLITTTTRLREARSQASAPPRSPPSSPPRRRPRADLDGEGIQTDEDGDDDDGDDDATEESDGASSLKFLLTGVVKRNHLGVDDALIEDAQSVAECGRHLYSDGARRIILGYNEELERCLEWVAESPVRNLSPSSSPGREDQHNLTDGGWTGTVGLEVGGGGANGGGDDASAVLHRQGTELSDRIMLLRRLKQNMGRTALMLSGGGAQAMYHLGTVRALVESGLYGDVKVISGTSGGSITAAMCAMKTPEELYKDVCVPHVSTDYMLDGTMKRENIRWFPKLADMIPYWLKHKLMVDSAEFKRTCDFYWGDVTFEEAYERTGKHVCITVSASRAGAGGKAQRLLLNHISTPHVTLASAVACSCALPGVMAPAKLVTKNGGGKKEPFEVDGVEWIDGSVQADLPFKRISTLFNVSNFVVSQTNFHVVPLLRKAHHPGEHSLYWRSFQACEWDIRGRALTLSRLGLFPKIFGHDMSKVFKQKYHGNLTLVPRFTTMQLFGLKALVNPTFEDMVNYLKYGQIAAWPYLTVIKEMLRVETKIDRCIARLEERLDGLVPDGNGIPPHSHDDDDVESISSSFVSGTNRLRFLSSHRETELLRQKVSTLERENVQLRGQVEQLQRAMGIVNSRQQQQKRDDVVELVSPSTISFTTVSEDSDEPKQQGKGTSTQRNDGGKSGTVSSKNPT